jgi:hypothetical protein
MVKYEYMYILCSMYMPLISMYVETGCELICSGDGDRVLILAEVAGKKNEGGGGVTRVGDIFKGSLIRDFSFCFFHRSVSSMALNNLSETFRFFTKICEYIHI